MRVCVVNLSGNVGKSVIATHMLAPRLQAKLLRVETVNSDAASPDDADPFKGRQLDMLLETMLNTVDSCVIDVGSSNAEAFFKRLEDFDGSHEEFDAFVVPVTTPIKQQVDSVNTIVRLRALGVPADKIRVLCNRTDPDTSITAEFRVVGEMAPAQCRMAEAAQVRQTDLFDLLRVDGRTLAAVLSDRTDYRAAISQAENPQQRTLLIRRLALSRLARSTHRNLDAAFGALFADS